MEKKELSTFKNYVKFIRSNVFTKKDNSLPKELLITEQNDISIYYAPFDYINYNAKIVICGITPGYSQAILALNEANKYLNNDCKYETVLKAVKGVASFGGPMRHNLIEMLDFIGIPEKIGIESSVELFGSRKDIVHYTSALKYPVFNKGKNYNGTPSMIKNPLLKKQLDTILKTEVTRINNDAIYIPLGTKVEEALNYLIDSGYLKSSQVLDGIPHPSGANAERIAYFLNKKKKNDLSKKTNAKIIDERRKYILAKVAALNNMLDV